MGNYHCIVADIDGLIIEDLEEFADYLPEGVTLKPPPLFGAHMSTKYGCLCPIDMGATAEANGYRAELRPGTSVYAFHQK